MTTNNTVKSLVKHIRSANVTYLITEKNDKVSNLIIDHFKSGGGGVGINGSNGSPTKEYVTNLLSNGSVFHREPLENFKNKTIPKPIRILNDEIIEKGSLLKFFLYPRYDNVDHIDCTNLNKYIIFENQHFIVIDKPHGISLGPIVDNLSNNFTYMLKEWLIKNGGSSSDSGNFNSSSILYNPHRIDSPTRGLCVIAKDLEFLRRFNKQLANTNEISKVYKAFIPKIDGITTNLKPGIYKHWMKNSKYSPKELFNKDDINIGDGTGYSECILEILNTVEKDLYVPLDTNDVSLDLLSSESSNEIGKGNLRKRCKKLTFYIIEIKLITGKTHQIRTQLSKLGYPLFSDLMYGGISLKSLLNEQHKDNLDDYPKMIGLISYSLSFKCPLTNIDFNFKL